MKWILFFLLSFSIEGYSQINGVGINTTQPKGILDMSTEDGSNSMMAMVLPRVENPEAVLPIANEDLSHATLVYDKSENCPKVFLKNINSWSACLAGNNNIYSSSEPAEENDCFIFNKVNYCVVKSSNGKLWLNKDLESTAYYQWGRGTDGHQISSSPVINLNVKPIPFVSPIQTEFIINYNDEKNWVNSAFTNHSQLWDPTLNPTNNPCPLGWKVPNETDLTSLNVHDINVLFGMNIDNKGIRQADKEGTYNYGGYFIWTSTLDQTDTSKAAKISSGLLTIVSQRRDAGLRIRCVKQ